MIAPIKAFAPPDIARTACAFVSIVLVAVFVGCRERSPEENLSKKAPSQVHSAARPAPSARVEKPSPGPLAEWVEARNYRLRVLHAVPCDTTDPDTEGASSAPGKFRLGVSIEVEAKAESVTAAVVVSPKAATIVKNGKVFEALTDPQATSSCDDLIGLEQLAPHESTRGTLVFEAPNEAYLSSGSFTFQPPRWGGETRLEVKLPDCFGANCS